MVVKKRKIKIDGEEHEVPTFDTKLKPGEVSEDTVAKIQREEKIEKEIHEIKEKIKSVKRKFPRTYKSVSYSYGVGKLLNFVDKRGYTSERRQIWERLAQDLEPNLFRIGPSVGQLWRYPEFMYLLSKVPESLLLRATWDQWYEILKFRGIYKDRALLRKILREAQERGISRDRIKELRNKKSRKV